MVMSKASQGEDGLYRFFFGYDAPSTLMLGSRVIPVSSMLILISAQGTKASASALNSVEFISFMSFVSFKVHQLFKGMK